MIYNLEIAVCLILNAKLMKLLMLLPNVVLIAISGINLSNEFSGQELNNSLAIIVLHLSVLILCLTFTALIVKSMFKIKYVEMPDLQTEDSTSYSESAFQHTA